MLPGGKVFNERDKLEEWIRASPESIPFNHNGYGAPPPNRVAVEAALKMIGALWGLGETSVTHSREDDGGIILFSHLDEGIYIDIECGGGGENTILIGGTKPEHCMSTAWDITEPEEIETCLRIYRERCAK